MATEEITEQYTPDAIRKKGIEALTRELGPIGMARFFQQFNLGEGDYTKEREALLAGITMDDVESYLAKKAARANL